VPLVDQRALAQALHCQRLLPLGGARLEELAGHLLDQGFRTRWREELHAARARSLALSALTQRAIELLEEAGIPAMPLKGPSLASALYGDPGMRTSDDADLLVRAGDLSAAIEVIRGLGYREPESVPPHPLHQAMVHADGRAPQIELHWRIHWYESRFSDALLERATTDDQGLLRPRPTDELAMLLLFFARDGFLGLRLAADVAACWDRRGSEIEPGALGALADDHPELRDALVASALAAERLVGLPAYELGIDGERSGRRQRLAVRLANWAQRGSVRQVQANIKLVDWMLTPPGGRREYMQRHLLPGRRAETPFAQALTSSKLLARYGFALWGIRGGRSWAPLPYERVGTR
jgi:Uncharacterised nucleotidyltransferase